MTQARYFCPDCGSIDLNINIGITKTASCPNCSWEGPLSQTVGAVTSEQFWDSERVGEVLLRVLATKAAGPVVQVLEFIGLLPRKKVAVAELTETEAEDLQRWNAAAQQARDAVMRSLMAAALSAAFEEAEKQHRAFAIATDTPVHDVIADKVFGGNVTPIGRKKKK